MASNYKSIEQVNKFAQDYKTIASSFLANTSTNTLATYKIPEDSVDAFNNIITFVLHSSLKNSEHLDGADDQVSTMFKDLLIKYYDNELSDTDIINLLNLIRLYNNSVDDAYDYKEKTEAKDDGTIEIIETVNAQKFDKLFGIDENYETNAHYFNNIVQCIYDDINTPADLVEGDRVVHCYPHYYFNSSSNSVVHITSEDAKNNNSLYKLDFSKIKEYSWAKMESLPEDGHYLPHKFTSTAITNNNKLEFKSNKEDIPCILFNNKLVKSNYLIQDQDNNSNNSSYYEIQTGTTYHYYYYDSPSNMPVGLYSKYTYELHETTPSDKQPTIYQAKKDLNGSIQYEEVKNLDYIITGYNLKAAEKEELKEELQYSELRLFIEFLVYRYMLKVCEIRDNGTYKLSDESTIHDISDIIGYTPANTENTNAALNETDKENAISAFIKFISIANLDIPDYIEKTIQKNKIFYTVPKTDVVNTRDVLDSQNKRGANSDEAYKVSKFENACTFNIINVPISKSLMSSDLKTWLGLDNTGTSGEKTSETYNISVGCVYKELNNNYRDIEHSDIIDFGLALLGDETIFKSSSSNLLISSSLDAELKNLSSTYPDISSLQLLNALRANPYYARKARESDIISYLAGSYLAYDYGGSSDSVDKKYIENKEIELFLDIYQETRDYYYKKLLNKSFVHDEYYNNFEKFFIVFYAIERFLSAKIDTVHDIDHFDSTDIYNFLETYGLSVLNKSKVFYNELTYKLNIIREFKTLIQNKGTIKVVEDLMKVFNGKNSSIDINKYIIADISNITSSSDNYNITSDTASNYIYMNNNYEEMEYNSSYTYDNGCIYESNKSLIGYYTYKTTFNKDASNIKFIEIDYDTQNETKELLNKYNNSQDYSSFINTDKYWSKDLLDESDLKNLNLNTSPTKYTSFEYASNISETFLKTLLSLEVMDYIYDKFIYSGSNTDGKSDTYHLTDVQFSVNELDNITFDGIYRVIRLLFRMFVVCSDYDTYGKQSEESTVAVQSDTTTKNYKYLTVNREANIQTFQNNLNTKLDTFKDKDVHIPSLILKGNIPISNLKDFESYIYYDINNAKHNTVKSVLTVLHNGNDTTVTSIDLFDKYALATNTISILNDQTDNKNLFINGTNFISNYKSIYGVSDNNTPTLEGTKNNIDTMVKYFINPLIQFPYEYIAAHNNISYNSDYMTAFINTDFRILTDTLFETFYLEDSASNQIIKYNYKIDDADDVALLDKLAEQDTNLSYFTENLHCTLKKTGTCYEIGEPSGELTDSDINEHMTKIITLGNMIMSVYEYLIAAYNTSTNMQNTADFLVAAIKMFISYTSQITEVRAVQKYSLPGENVIPTDTYISSIKTTNIDSFYYDESVTYTKQTFEAIRLNEQTNIKER